MEEKNNSSINANDTEVKDDEILGEEDFQYRKEILAQIKLAIPYAASRIIDVIRNFVGNAYLSRLGPNYVAAGGLIGSSQLIALSPAAFALYAEGIVLGRESALTPKNTDSYKLNISDWGRTGFLFSLMLAIPSVTLGLCSGKILRLLGQEKHLAAITEDYFHGYCYGLPFTLLLTSLQQFTLGMKDGNIVMASNLLNASIAITLYYLMIEGKGSIPRLGAEGFGYANSISSFISFFALLLYVSCSKKYTGIRLIGLPRRTNIIKMLSDLAKIGGSIAVRIGSELIALAGATALAGLLGDDPLQAVQIATQYTFLMMVPLFALSQTTAISTGKYVQMKKPENVRRAVALANGMGLAVSGLMAVVISATTKPLISLFIDPTKEPKVAVMARDLLFINAASQLLNGPKNLCGAVLNVVHDVKTPLWSGLLFNAVLALGLGYCLGFSADMGVNGIFIARLAMMALTAVILMYATYARTSSAEAMSATRSTPWLFWRNRNTGERQWLLSAETSSYEDGESFGESNDISVVL